MESWPIITLVEATPEIVCYMMDHGSRWHRVTIDVYEIPADSFDHFLSSSGHVFGGTKMARLSSWPQHLLYYHLLPQVMCFSLPV